MYMSSLPLHVYLSSHLVVRIEPSSGTRPVELSDGLVFEPCGLVNAIHRYRVLVLSSPVKKGGLHGSGG